MRIILMVENVLKYPWYREILKKMVNQRRTRNVEVFYKDGSKDWFSTVYRPWFNQKQSVCVRVDNVVYLIGLREVDKILYYHPLKCLGYKTIYPKQLKKKSVGE